MKEWYAWKWSYEKRKKNYYEAGERETAMRI